MYATLIHKLNKKFLILAVIFSQNDSAESIHQVLLILDVLIFAVDDYRHCPLNYFAVLGCGKRDALARHASGVFCEGKRSCDGFVPGLGVMRRGRFVGLAQLEGLLVQQIRLTSFDSVRILEHPNHTRLQFPWRQRSSPMRIDQRLSYLYLRQVGCYFSQPGPNTVYILLEFVRGEAKLRLDPNVTLHLSDAALLNDYIRIIWISLNNVFHSLRNRF